MVAELMVSLSRSMIKIVPVVRSKKSRERRQDELDKVIIIPVFPRAHIVSTINRQEKMMLRLIRSLIQF